MTHAGYGYDMDTGNMRYHAEMAKLFEDEKRGDGRIPIRHELLSRIADELDRLQQAWILASDPPKHPNWVIAQDEQGNVFPATFRGLRWLDDEGDELPPYYPQIVKWCEMPKGE